MLLLRGVNGFIRQGLIKSEAMGKVLEMESVLQEVVNYEEN
jgi:hypothetical protein